MMGARGRDVDDRSHLSLRDLANESLMALVERVGRSALTATGTVMGIGLLVAVLGLAGTASAQISERFDLLKATEVTVTDARADTGTVDGAVFPADADDRARALNGVVAAGVTWLPRDAQVAVHGAPIGADAGASLPVVAASAGYLSAAEVTVAEGRSFDSFHDDSAQLVVVLGRAAASQLGITRLDDQPAVFIGDTPLTVVGIISDAPRAPNLLLSVVVPRGTAERLWGQPDPGSQATMLVVTRAGAAPQVAGELPLALRPDAPSAVGVVPPPDPRTLREGVNTDLATLFLLLAGISLLVGIFGIANTTLVAVLERTSEIGLRRALGAARRHIVQQILAESGALGALGGIVGTSLGLVVVVAVCLPRGWSPVIDPRLVVAAPLVGLVAGVVAGVYPAVRAGRIEPVEALRR